MSTFDDALTYRVGALGPWQISLFLIVVLAATPPILQFPQLATLTPSFSCPGFDNGTDACAAEVNGTGCPGGWHYDVQTAPFRWSLTQEFDLVCSRRFFIPFSSMAYMVGLGIGYACGGYLGDRFGRRYVCLLSCLGTFVVSLGVSFSVDIWMFVVLRVVAGAVVSVAHVTSYVFCAELTNAKHRNTFNFIYSFLNDVVLGGYAVLMAYLLQNWRLYHSATAAVSLLAFGFWCFVPESPRWLLSRGRVHEAREVLLRGSKWNGKKGEELTVESFQSALVLPCTGSNEKQPPLTSWLDIFRKGRMRRSTLALSVLWFTMGLNYYGLYFFAVRLEGNPYVIAFVGGLLGLPAGIVKTLLYHFFDRIRPLLVLLAIGTVICAAAVLVYALALPISIVPLATAAISISAASFMMAYTITPEHYPTAQRSSAFGFLSSLARAGSALGVFVERLDVFVWPAMPMIIFGSFFLLSFLAILTMPTKQIDDDIAVELSLNVEEDNEMKAELDV